MGAKVPYIEGWRCYKPGDLNPHLVSFDYSDILNNPLTSYSSNPMSSIGEALNRAIRPDTTRGTKSSSVKAVVLGGYVVQGREALSYNMKVDSFGGALANRVQILYIRVPELSNLPDPYCKDNICTIEQASVVVEMHPTAVLPNFISPQPNIVPGSIVEVEFSEAFSRAIVTKILEEATNFEMAYSNISGKEAFSASGNGTFLAQPPAPIVTSWDKIFSAQGSPTKHFIKESLMPNKLNDLDKSLQQYIHSKGRTDVSIAPNGYRRSLQKTFEGGAGRSVTSLHMLALAYDVQITTKDITTYGYSGKAENDNGTNGKLIHDHELMRILRAFAREKRFLWGGTFKQGNPESIPATEGESAFTAYTMELHHFELLAEDYEYEINSKVKGAIIKSGYKVADLLSSGARKPLYQLIKSELTEPTETTEPSEGLASH